MEYMEYQPLLSAVTEQYKQILRENLVGIYVHGSIAFGCFSWDRSDIDFLAVINAPISQQKKLQLLQALISLSDKAPQKGFEMSLVLKKHCKTFTYPTPYELHFSNDHSENLLSLCNDDPKYDPDLAAHFTVMKQLGLVFYGEPIARVFGAVPREDYFDSICKDMETATEKVLDQPVYTILNLCRVYGYRKDNLILSKAEGGLWGLENLPETYHSLIAGSLDAYSKGTAFSEEKSRQIEFCKYMLDLIFNPRT